ncbi:LysM peptidoglycan-binding domain-containing protein [Cryobacterium melibiosiphilum]|uniref:LysM peptidoglycan-binding domain-containing protein n=1 Tax=Cryobacterium melibiosiphilum TaxID=995039 RepID=A0A3A5MIP8_9MICO|nr:LysM peptidoglycan-binding domain-containing protein [Cryobacterium melibiosiphilum]RJT88925.1 LysM peptidoglycan-binding domain-containing protein [Cryobacterium melibiosiphilum]
MSAVISIRSAATRSASARSASVPSASVRSTLRLTRRGRVVFTTLAAIPVVAAAFVLALNGGLASAAGPTNAAALVTFDYVTIQAGESLWQIAESIAPTADPRDVIAEIVSLNRLSVDAVEPGQRLALPLAYSAAD